MKIEHHGTLGNAPNCYQYNYNFLQEIDFIYSGVEEPEFNPNLIARWRVIPKIKYHEVNTKCSTIRIPVGDFLP